MQIILDWSVRKGNKIPFYYFPLIIIFNNEYFKLLKHMVVSLELNFGQMVTKYILTMTISFLWLVS